MSYYTATILIPTCNRPEFIGKLVDYLLFNLNASKIKIIILDGSDENGKAKNRATCEGKPVEYLWFDKTISYFQRMLLGLEAVETNIVSILGDDDILFPKGFIESVLFLRDNEDFSIAHGQYIGFSDIAGVKFNKTYISDSICSENVFCRLFDFFSSYTAPTYYAVTRTKYLIKSFQLMVENNIMFNDHFSAESLISAIPLINGKLKRLNSFYQARNFNPVPEGHYVVYAKYIANPDFSTKYQKVKTSLMNQLMSTVDIDENIVSDALDYTFAAFWGQRIATNEMRSRFQALNINL